MIPPDPRIRLAELERRCAKSGIPLTAQRRTVLEVLVARDDHPTVDQIFQAVAERLPEVSRATVYRSLETLSDLGLLKRVEHPGSVVRFDGNTDPHHHFLCTRCNGIEDLPLESVHGHDELKYVGEGPARVEELAVLVRGTCARCAGAA